MIAGRLPTHTALLPNWSPNNATPGNAAYSFECWHESLPNGRSGMYQSIPACPPGGHLKIMVVFPDCWDGDHLDSPNHRDHMEFSSWGCPASHPVLIPQLTFNVEYEVPPGDNARNWKLSSDTGIAGTSVHVDADIAWNPDKINAVVEFCLKAGRDCHSHLYGDGTQFNGPPSAANDDEYEPARWVANMAQPVNRGPFYVVARR
jgi:hypothetical protein